MTKAWETLGQRMFLKLLNYSMRNRGAVTSRSQDFPTSLLLCAPSGTYLGKQEGHAINCPRRPWSLSHHWGGHYTRKWEMGPLAQSCLSLCCSRKTSVSYDPYAIVSSLSWEDSGPGWWLFFFPIMEMNHWVVLIKSSLSFNHRGITDKGGFLGHWVCCLPAWTLPPTTVLFPVLCPLHFLCPPYFLWPWQRSPDSVTCRHAVILDCLHHLSPRQWFILIPQGEVCLLGFPHFAQTIPEGYFAPAPEARPGDMKVRKTQFLRAQASIQWLVFTFFFSCPPAAVLNYSQDPPQA